MPPRWARAHSPKARRSGWSQSLESDPVFGFQPWLQDAKRADFDRCQAGFLSGGGSHLKNSNNGRTPLHSAAFNGMWENAKRSGVFVRKRRLTPLHFSFGKQCVEFGSRSSVHSISFSSWQLFAIVSKVIGRCFGRVGQVVAVVYRTRVVYPWVDSRIRTASKQRRPCAVRQWRAASSESGRVRLSVARALNSSKGMTGAR